MHIGPIGLAEALGIFALLALLFGKGIVDSVFGGLLRALSPALRRINWLRQSLTGTEEERIAAERAVGRDLAAAVLVSTGAAAAVQRERLARV